ncbi:hypothetical protein GQ42DRAFT_153250 [Ramicandelaber brevisporus]|nr:hypothetical protein GQ42DRAFT_153250 [Ramicandelaber brevisporus]
MNDEPTVVVVTGLSLGVNSSDIRRHFQSCGKIRSARVVKDPATNVSRGYGYVTFNTPASCQASLELNSSQLQLENGTSCTINVQQYDKSGKDPLTVYVTGLAAVLSDADVETIFGAFGTVTSVRLPKAKSGQQKLYGYVSFAEEASAQAALSLNGVELVPEYGPISVAISDPSLARSKRSDQPAKDTVFVRGIKGAVTEQDVERVFGQAGQIVSVNLPRNADGSIKGFAFVKYSNEQDAERAVNEMAGAKLGNRKSKIVVVIADDRRSSTASTTSTTSESTTRTTEDHSERAPAATRPSRPRMLPAQIRHQVQPSDSRMDIDDNVQTNSAAALSRLQALGFT